MLLALLFTGLQSLVFSIVMEFIARPVIHKLGYFVLVSGILGLLSGLIPGALTANLERFLLIGILVGIFVGLLLYDKGNASNQSI